MNGKTIWREVRFLGLILFGSVCYAIGFDLFLMLHQVNAGGVSGASMLICAALGWDGGVGILTLGINVPLFLLGYRYLGKRFFVGSIVGTIATSAFIELFARIPAPQTDIMLGVLYGGVLVGLGLGVVFYAGASTGGVDIIASLLRKKFRSISVGNLMLAVDSAVIILTGVVYRDINKTLYSALTLFLCTTVLDAVIFGLNDSTVALIISDSYAAIAREIEDKLARGVTMLSGYGGYTGAEKMVLLVAVRKQQTTQLKMLVERIDPEAFLILQRSHQVLGNGFGRYSDNV
mgnify:FL=1